MKLIKLLFLFVMLNLAISKARILQVAPAFPTASDDITVIYDATQGNGALTGVSPVYPEDAGLLAAFSSLWMN
jgi:hypothetical protein